MRESKKEEGKGEGNEREREEYGEIEGGANGETK